jgi:hypothetical protein
MDSAASCASVEIVTISGLSFLGRPAPFYSSVKGSYSEDRATVDLFLPEEIIIINSLGDTIFRFGFVFFDI